MQRSVEFFPLLLFPPKKALKTAKNWPYFFVARSLQVSDLSTILISKRMSVRDLSGYEKDNSQYYSVDRVNIQTL